jgi:hypothetical protein
MARAAVVQCRCDRCKRVELVPPGAPNKGADFDATFCGKRLVYEDLCQRCRAALETTWQELLEWDRPVKHQFGAPPPNTAPPLVPAPDLVPPKPHSGANANKK